MRILVRHAARGVRYHITRPYKKKYIPYLYMIRVRYRSTVFAAGYGLTRLTVYSYYIGCTVCTSTCLLLRNYIAARYKLYVRIYY